MGSDGCCWPILEGRERERELAGLKPSQATGALIGPVEKLEGRREGKGQVGPGALVGPQGKEGKG